MHAKQLPTSMALGFAIWSRKLIDCNVCFVLVQHFMKLVSNVGSQSTAIIKISVLAGQKLISCPTKNLDDGCSIVIMWVDSLKFSTFKCYNFDTSCRLISLDLRYELSLFEIDIILHLMWVLTCYQQSTGAKLSRGCDGRKSFIESKWSQIKHEDSKIHFLSCAHILRGNFRPQCYENFIPCTW